LNSLRSDYASVPANAVKPAGEILENDRRVSVIAAHNSGKHVVNRCLVGADVHCVAWSLNCTGTDSTTERM
jgi:hypothetical protein